MNIFGLLLRGVCCIGIFFFSHTKGQGYSSGSVSVSQASTDAASLSSAPAGVATASSFSTGGNKEERADPLHGYRIVCLYNHKQYMRQNFSIGMIDPNICTHINYEFAQLHPKSYEMIAGEPSIDIDAGMYKESIKLREKNPQLKIMLSLGGWEDSTEKYSQLADSAMRVENFIHKAVAFLKQYQFDGLDFAWEYPNCMQGDLGKSPKDKKNFSELLEKLRKRFDKENLILSISVAAIRREILAAYDGPAISKVVHHINVMTYDMHGPWEKVTGHHTQMDKVDGDKDPYLNAKAAMQVWADIGVEKLKLNLGVATYAKTYTLVDPSRHGLNAPAKGPGRPGPVTGHSGFLCYHELCQFLNSGKWKEDEQKAAGFYAYSGDQWACYDPPMMMVRKAKWVVESGYGGILVKDMSCDDFRMTCFKLQYPLTKMIKMEMISKIKSKSSARNIPVTRRA